MVHARLSIPHISGYIHYSRHFQLDKGDIQQFSEYFRTLTTPRLKDQSALRSCKAKMMKPAWPATQWVPYLRSHPNVACYMATGGHPMPSRSEKSI